MRLNNSLSKGSAMAATAKSDSAEKRSAFWNTSAEHQFQQLTTTLEGLSYEEADRRIKRYGANRLNNKKGAGNLQLFFAQFKSSIILILLFATGLSFFLRDRLDAAIILTIVLISTSFDNHGVNYDHRHVILTPCFQGCRNKAIHPGLIAGSFGQDSCDAVISDFSIQSIGA
jgi:magnesium-transporting ATPase (P-type)